MTCMWLRKSTDQLFWTPYFFWGAPPHGPCAQTGTGGSGAGVSSQRVCFSVHVMPISRTTILSSPVIPVFGVQRKNTGISTPPLTCPSRFRNAFPFYVFPVFVAPSLFFVFPVFVAQRRNTGISNQSVMPVLEVRQIPASSISHIFGHAVTRFSNYIINSPLGRMVVSGIFER